MDQAHIAPGQGCRSFGSLSYAWGMPILENLVFNFIPIDPEVAGGIATVCQMMATHLPPELPDSRTLVLTGGHAWGNRFPLAGRTECMDIASTSSQGAGLPLLAMLSPSHTPGVGSRLWSRLLRRDPAFPPDLASKTVVHCPYQILHPKPGRHWNLPYVINLHDLQHEHFPEFFTAKDLERRKTRYLASALAAQAVCVVDEWTRRDVLSHLPIPESKVHVAPFGPTWEEAAPLTPEDRDHLLERYDLPPAFAFYPAQTWPHKNHARLVEALGALKQKGVEIPLVCTGHINDHGTKIMAQVEASGLGSQVRFLGLIPGPDIKRLYQAARMTVIPTLFEGGPGIPVLESMALGSPLAASTACGIPEAVGDSAVLFDPLDVGDMVRALERLWTDDALRGGLAEAARRRSALNTWKRAAATYRDVYAEALLRWKAEHGQ